MAARTLFNVSNRLPITLSGGEIVKSSGGLVAALEGLPADRFDLQWIGWPGSEIEESRRDEIARTLPQQHGCVPVFLSAAEAEGHYEGFSNSSLWPLLHYMPSRMRYEAGWWQPYHDVNQRFADRVLELADEDDLVWVHDYQLMLVPAMLRSARPGLRVGFFLHTPFPSYEVFRLHPRRQELIEGLLGADQIGFHTFGYMRHFRSSVLRLLGIESELTQIRHEGRTSRMGVYPIGINAGKFEQELDKPQCLHEQRQHLRELNGGRKVVLSVERLDYTKGILHRLDAIDLLLAQMPERERVKFIFVSVPSREGVEEYRELREEVEARVGRLNGRYATLHNSPIRFIHGSVNFAELCALYATADVGLVTPLIDGMNLVAKEYVACQRDDRAGVLVLSEFAGAAEELFNALIVNPYDTVAVANAIRQALEMPQAERSWRMRPMRQRVLEFDAPAWARLFVDDLSAARRGEVEGNGPSSPAAMEQAKTELRVALAADKSIAMFLDYDGTLREIERDPASAAPTPAIRQLLDALCDAGLGEQITITSGRTPRDLETWLGEYPFGLIAEHGANIRRPGSREWEQLDRNVSYAWKDEIRRVLEFYQTTTPGSFIEDKRTSLVWHYRRSDPEFGSWKARQLVTELAQLAANEPIEVRHGRKIVEVTATQVNKGAAVMRVLEGRPCDVVLVAGDDATDESMYRVDAANLISIRVGAGETRAQLRLHTPAQFRAFLLDAVIGRRSGPPAPGRRGPQESASGSPASPAAILR